MHIFKVPGQSSRIAELFAAHVTSKRSFVLVDSHVSQIRILQLEASITFDALERILLMRRFFKNLAQIFTVLFIIKYQMHRVVVRRNVISLVFLHLMCDTDRPKLVVVLEIRMFYRMLHRNRLSLHYDRQLNVTLLFRHGRRLIVRRVHDGDPDRVGILGRRVRLCKVADSRLGPFPVWLPKCFWRVRGHF